MKHKLKLALGAASLIIISNTAVAEVPNAVAGNDFDQYTVDASGNVVLNNAGGTWGCPIGGTCTVLEATGPGILQQKVNFGGGVEYFQTIIVDDGAVSVADPTILDFRNESYVDATGFSLNIAQLGVVQELDGGLDDFVTEFEGQNGVLRESDTSNPTGLRATETIHQANELGPGRTSEVFIENNPFQSGQRMAINVAGLLGEGQFTLRKATGNMVDASGSIVLDNGANFAFAPGDSIQVIHLTQASWAGLTPPGIPLNNVLGLTIARLLADSGGASVTTEIRQDNNDGTGKFITTGGAAGTPLTGSGPFLNPWLSSDLLGTEPLAYTDSGGGFPIAPAGGFFPAPPAWNDI